MVSILFAFCLTLFAPCSVVSASYFEEQCVPARYNTSAARVERKINVHLIPHTHDDTGWLKTIDQYYYGSRQDIQVAGVQYVLDTVIYALLADPNRKFAYAEMSFFTRWWAEQSQETQSKVKKLVEEGRLSFINGGWVQHDEAAAHYVAMIDQTTRGHRFLNKTFGYRPRVGWQIDPFGHSSTHASLMSAYLGFDGLFFGRSDYQDLERRKKTKELEMLWRGAESFGKQADIFLGTFPTGNYGPPAGFYFDWGNWDPPVQDNVCLTELNVEERVDSFVKAAEDMAEMYQDNDLFWPMGTDFTYSNAFTWYKNMDKLIHYVNQDGRVNAFYSTPAEYVDVKNGLNHSWPLKTDDFFPYADCPHCYWTGYFTSRAASKGFIRRATSYLQIARQLEFITGKAGHSDILDEAVALLQHHDSITGTEKQHVTNDYHKRLSKGWIHAERFINKALAHLVYGPKSVAETLQQALSARLFESFSPRVPSLKSDQKEEDLLLLLHQCPFLNVSVCEASLKYSLKEEAFLVVVYNPLAWPRKAPVEVPMAYDPKAAWGVKDSEGKQVESTWLKTGHKIRDLQETLFDNKALPSLRGASSSAIGFVSEVPAMGYQTYCLGPLDEDSPNQALHPDGSVAAPGKRTISSINAAKPPRIIQGRSLALTLAEGTGQLVSLKAGDEQAVSLDISGCWYNSSSEQGPDGGVPSGAYIFRPDGPCYNSTPTLLSQMDNSLLYQAEHRLLDSLTILTRWWKELDFLEITWTAGPINIKDGLGKELVLKYGTNLSTGSSFYTDANGRELQKRVLDYRPTWDLKVEEPVSGNYYPLTAAIAVKDKDAGELSVLVDRAQGGSSLKNGGVEIMVHRRTLFDDSRGVAEPLNETIASCRNCNSPGLIVRGTHLLAISGSSAAAAQRRLLQQQLNDPPLIAFGPVPTTSKDIPSNKMNGHFTALGGSKASLPHNVHIITIQVLEEGQLLLRLAHLFQVGENAGELAEAAKLDLNSIFSGIRFQKVVELGLAGAQPIDTIKRLDWHEGSPIHGREGKEAAKYFREAALHCVTKCTQQNLTFTLKPMEIRTFLLSVDSKPVDAILAESRTSAS